MEKLSPVIIAIPIYFLLIAVELAIQYFSGKKLYRTNDAISNISCGIVQQLSGIFLRVLSVGAYVLVFEYLRFNTIEANWYTWILLFIAVDFFYYWAHRMSHEINLFWGGHVVHHQSEDYNFSVALRQSSFQVVWTFAFYLPLALVGFDPLDFLFINALTTVYQFWIHTETIGRLGILELVFNTPSHHRVHHGKDPKYIDKNHAGVFIIWDKMFGTFQKEEEKPTYGITNPLNSWNPVWANFDHYELMFRELRTIKGLKNKLLYLFKKPGWLPDSMGGYRAPKPIDKETYSKYDRAGNLSLHLYAIGQFLIVLAITAYFLFNTKNMEPLQLLSICIWIIMSVSSLGGLFENKRWAQVLEVVRLVMLAGFPWMFIDPIEPVHYLMLLVPLLSMIHFILTTYGKKLVST